MRFFELTRVGVTVTAEDKVVRITDVADAKAFVEAAPKMVKEGISKADADEIKKKLEAAGAKVTVK